MIFQLKYGSHVEKGVTYEAGQTLDSPIPLDKVFPDKFVAMTAVKVQSKVDKPEANSDDEDGNTDDNAGENADGKGETGSDEENASKKPLKRRK
jgi:hypothetical protein